MFHDACAIKSFSLQIVFWAHLQKPSGPSDSSWRHPCIFPCIRADVKNVASSLPAFASKGKQNWPVLFTVSGCDPCLAPGCSSVALERVAGSGFSISPSALWRTQPARIRSCSVTAAWKCTLHSVKISQKPLQFVMNFCVFIAATFPSQIHLQLASFSLPVNSMRPLFLQLLFRSPYL